ncbi:MAG TPA: HepT-like ribonuclease domain-containing protein [Anaeromyxobacteraceae bacterium]
MLDAARKAVELTSGKARDEIAADEVVQLALARLLEILSEASLKLSPELRDAHPEIPWAEIRGLRNRLVHAYFDIDLDVLMDIAAQDLPALIGQLERLLTS